jgi:hypothetical protein
MQIVVLLTAQQAALVRGPSDIGLDAALDSIKGQRSLGGWLDSSRGHGRSGKEAVYPDKGTVFPDQDWG